MPSFFAASNPHDAALDKRVQAFKQQVLYPNSALYDAGYFALDDPHIAWFLSNTAPALPQIYKFTELIDRSLPQYEAAFESTFPKFDPKTVSVYLMPSMGAFDGMTKDINSSHSLLIGVDAFAHEKLPMGVFLDHEMFHIYHHEINPAFFATPSENDLYPIRIIPSTMGGRPRNIRQPATESKCVGCAGLSLA